jgi:hypothetical protein
MPSTLIKNYAKESGKPINEVEKLWQKAKTIAKKKFATKDSEYYAYTVGILKNMLSISSQDEAEYIGGCITHKKGCSKIKLMGAVHARQVKKPESLKWWNKLSHAQQKKYLQKYPNSGFKHHLKQNTTHTQTSTKEEKSEFEGVEPGKGVVPVSTEQGVEPGKEVATVNEKYPDVIDEEEDAEFEDIPEEPKSLENMTPSKQLAIVNVVKKDSKKFTHIIKERPETVTKGLSSLKNFSMGKKLDAESKEHLKDLAMIVMGVTLAAALAFTPIAPYSAGITLMYLEEFHKRMEKRKEESLRRREEEKEQLDDFQDSEEDDEYAEEKKHLKNLSVDMAEWVTDQDPDKLIKEAKSRGD